VKLRITAFLAATVLVIVGAVGPASAQASAGNPLKIETSVERLSGTAGDYVELPAVITNTSDKSVNDVISYVTLVETTRGQQAPVDLEDWSAQRTVTI
jgi:S1-C subfamily serine protease